MARSDDLAALTEIAADQAGYVTTRQAGRLGVDAHRLARLAMTRDVRRVRSGVYAMRHASHRLENEISAWLSIDRTRLPWERNGNAVAVLSHATAASLLDLGTVVPRLPALTVPPDRRSASRGRGIELHVAPLTASDWTWHQETGIRLPTTTWARTIIDLVLTGEEPSYIMRGIDEGIHAGHLTPTELVEAGRRRRHNSATLVRRLEALLSGRL